MVVDVCTFASIFQLSEEYNKIGNSSELVWPGVRR